MIRKRIKRLVVYGFLAVAVFIIGFYMYKSIVDTNKIFEQLNEEDDTVATAVSMDGVDYTVENGKFRWGLVIPSVELEKDAKYHTITNYQYSVEQMTEAGYKLNVKYIVKDDVLYAFESSYVAAHVKSPWVPSSGILLYCIAGLLTAAALYQLVRILIVTYILKKGTLTTGTFISAFHTSFGSAKYYKVKFTYTHNGETYTVVTPNCYDRVAVDKFERIVVLEIRVLGKRAIIAEKD